MNQKRKNISRSREKPDCIPNNDQNNRSIGTTKIFLSFYKFYDMDQKETLSLNHKVDRAFIPYQYAQTKTHQSGTDLNPVSSLQQMDSKRMRLRFSFPFSVKPFLMDG